MYKVGLLTDSINFPNFIKKFDIVHISKIFNLNLRKIDPLIYVPQAQNIYKGGSGFAIKVINNVEVYIKNQDPPLSQEIENFYPDYSLYPKFTNNTAYGYLTRGCPNNCKFCIVCKKDGLQSKKVADLKQFWGGQKNIRLLDANILACKDRDILFQQLIDSRACVDYTQGIDARLINNETATAICLTKPKIVHFSWDLMKNEVPILNGLKIFSRHYKKTFRNKRVYILTNYNTTHQEDYYRVKRIMELGYSAYIMIYQKGTQSQFLTDLARWANNICLFTSTSFKDYIPRKNSSSAGVLYKEILRSV